MKKIISEKGVFGPFNDIAQMGGDCVADNSLFYVSVFGAMTVEDWEGPVEVVDLQEARTQLKLKLSEVARAKRQAGCMVSGMLIATDAESLALLVGGKQGGKALRKVVTKSGALAQLSSAQFAGLVDAVDNYLQAVIDRHYDLVGAINNAATEAALGAIDINTGWPS